MSLKNILLFGCIGAAIICSFASASSAFAADYLSGPAICSKGKFPREHGGYVEVPRSYVDSSSEKVKLYYWLNSEFDPQKPSAIYFVGGPGGHAHYTFSSLAARFSNWNFILFDPRGVFCSRPDTEQQFLESDQYSSVNTAMDAEQILNALGISKVTVIGASYGTIPATIFASRYSEKTRSLILEGVVDKAGDHLFISNTRIRAINQFWHELKNDQRLKIQTLDSLNDVRSDWFAIKASQLLYSSFFKENFSEFLSQEIFGKSIDQARDNVKYLKPTVQTMNNNDYMLLSRPVYQSIVCREMGGRSPTASFGLILDDDNEWHTDILNSPSSGICKGVETAEYPYDSKNFPVKAPIYYFNGKMDGATDFSNAQYHFQMTAKGRAYLFLFDQGGHHPLSDLVDHQGSLINHAAAASLENIFELAIEGSEVPSELVKQYNRFDFTKIDYLSK
jgi:proline iminopeptidase